MGRLYAVGIGPGDEKYLTGQALAAIEESEAVFGFGTYAELLKDRFPEKEYRISGMGQEVLRCREALLYASKPGACACIISSGDAGIYGMTGLLYELSADFEEAEIVAVPGISALISGGAVLGAPCMNDFCVLSLSDHLTPLETIKKRLAAACSGDMVICIYNPMSRTRSGYLKMACDILLSSGKDPNTVCGWVKNIGREGMESRVLSLKKLRDEELDMFTTVFVGNTQTVVIGGKMVTKRGYEVDRT